MSRALSSHQTFKASADSVRFDTVDLGGYATLRSGAFYANLLGQYAHYWVNASGTGWSDKVEGDAEGVQAEIGARLGSDALFVEPAASIAWQHSDIGSLTAFGQTIDFAGNDAVTGRIGGRVGGIVDLGGTRAVFYGRANYVHEFDGKGGLLFSSGVSQSVSGNRAGDYGEGAIGVNVLSEGRISGFIEGTATLGSVAKGGGGRVGIRIKL